MQEQHQFAIDIAEKTIKGFLFDSLDEITLGGLDSLIALKYEEYDNIDRCEVSTKLDDKNTETYVLVKMKGNDMPFTFVCIFKPKVLKK